MTGLVDEWQDLPPAGRKLFAAKVRAEHPHLAERFAAQVHELCANEGDEVGEKPGDIIGKYKLLQRLGAGAFGNVFEAEETGDLRRRVALKVLKPGMDSKQVLARFESEWQALAIMEHPNIAKVFGAGTTDKGRPYFVMELVHGDPITDYCDKHNLSTEERLNLFNLVCQAIQHAHHKGVIHRDIKPSNILVAIHDNVPVAKVIDFGIAKAIGVRLTDLTVVTLRGFFIGTLEYMSPEQAEVSGVDIDTRSDVYSLGVLLYELLTGQLPLDSHTLNKAGDDEKRRIIREVDPPKPSTRLTTATAEEQNVTARRRNCSPAKLSTSLRGDLDWIVMKALEKDRARRYETANGLAADIRRHLNHEPVQACPPSAAYLFNKIVRRHRMAFGAASVVAIVLVIATAISVWLAVRASRSEVKALEEKSNAIAALHFIQDDVLSQASPGYQADRDLKVRTLLDRIADRLDHTAGLPPLVDASIRQTVGSVYTELGDYGKAIQHYEVGLRHHRLYLGESHPDTLRSVYGLAMAHWWKGSTTQAKRLSGHGLDECQRVLGAKHPLTLQFLQAQAFARLYSGEMPWSKTEPLFLQALALHREALGSDNPGTLRLVYGLGLGYLNNWQELKAEPPTKDAIEVSRRTLGENHPLTVALISNMAYIHMQLNQLEEAEVLMSSVMERRRSILGEEHPLTVNSIINLARIYVQKGEIEKAEPFTSMALHPSLRLPIENSAVVALNLSILGWVYLEDGQLTKANALCELAYHAMKNRPNANPLANARITTQLGAVRLAQKKPSESEMLLREGLVSVKMFWPEAPYHFYVMGLLGASLLEQGKCSEAEPFLLESCRGLQQRKANIPPYLRPRHRATESFERVVQLYEVWAKPSLVSEWKQKLAAFELAEPAK